MPRKPEETHFLKRFLRTRPDLEGAVIDDGGERPDFVLTLRHKRLGIEHTRYSPPPGVHPHPIEQDSLQHRTLAVAGEMWRTAQRPPLDVMGLFNDHTPLTKARVPALARLIVQSLEKATAGLEQFQSVTIRGIDVWESMPELHSVRAMSVPEDSWGSWSTGQGGWVQRAPEDTIRRLVDAKEPLVPAYRERADEVWLLVTFEHMDAGDVVAAPETPVGFVVRTAFDRVFAFDIYAGRAVEIPTAHP